MITLDELRNAPDLDLKQKLDAFYDGTKCIYSFADEVMVPMLNGLIRPDEREEALKQIYLRMYLFLGSIIALNHLRHFQSVASATRSIFEVGIDIKALAADTTGVAITKFHQFPEVERYRTAAQLLEFATTNSTITQSELSHERAFYDDAARKTRVEQQITFKKNGKPIYPKHWSGNNNLRARAKNLNVEDWYVETYPRLSWYVHAGTTGTAAMSKEAFEAIFGNCHSLVQRMFLDATVLCAKTTRIHHAVESFGKWIDELWERLLCENSVRFPLVARKEDFIRRKVWIILSDIFGK